jgi:tripartite-type tricarboxylate transporter receptor subunit TctC
MPYQISDFAPISMIVQNSMVLGVHPSVAAKNLQELIALGKSDAKGLSFASAGNGSMSHMSLELLAAETGMNITHIPYGGSGRALIDVMAGTVPCMFDNPSSIVPLIKDAKLKALAYSGAKRSIALPNVPTVAEQGVAGFETNNWFGLFGPAKMDAKLVSQINVEVGKVLRSPAMAARFNKDGVSVSPSTPEILGAFVAVDSARWAKVIKARNIKPD